MKSSTGLILMCLVPCFLASPIFAAISNTDRLNEGIEKFDSGDLAGAKIIFENIVQEKPDNAEGQYYLGRIYERDGDLKKAEKYLKKAVELEETNSNYHNWLGSVYGRKINQVSIFKKPGMAKKIKKHFSRAIELDEDNNQARNSLITFYLEAPGIAGGSKDKALEHAVILAEKDPYFGHLAFARIYEKEEKFDQAAEAYEAAIAEQPKRLIPRYRLGYLYQNQEHYDNAFEVFEAMIADSSGNLGAHYQVARTSALSGQALERGVEAMQVFLQHEPSENQPSHAAAHWRLGMIYEHLQDKDSARREYESALELDPKMKHAKNALKKLK